MRNMSQPSATAPYVLILDDHPIVGRGMGQFLLSVQPNLEVRVCTNWDEVHAAIQAYGRPVLLVADVWLSEGSSLTDIANWRTENLGTPWLAISGDDDPSIKERVRAAGAQGFVHKKESPETFGNACAHVLTAGVWFEKSSNSNSNPSPNNFSQREWEVTPSELGLTARQGDILILLLRGLPNKRIALMLRMV